MRHIIGHGIHGIEKALSVEGVGRNKGDAVLVNVAVGVRLGATMKIGANARG